MSVNKKYINSDIIKNAYLENGINAVVKLYDAEVIISDSDINDKIQNLVFTNNFSDLKLLLESKYDNNFK